MNGNKLLVDTNIALYLLNGSDFIAELLQDSIVYISFITQLELFGLKGISNNEKEKIKDFLSDCVILDISEDIKQSTILLRQTHTIKLPDAIIAATSIALDIPFISADKNFTKIEELNLILFDEF